MAARSYEVKSIKSVGDPRKDTYGYYQDYAAILKGVGEPVKVSLPLPILEHPQPGDHLYGRLFEETGEGNRTYYRLKVEKRPESDLKALDIHAQVGVKLAVKLWADTQYESDEDRLKAYDNIANEALHFARIIDEVKEELIK